MKKFFTLIAAALMAVGASAQTITFDAYADKTAEGAADDLTIEDGDIKIALDGGSKAKIAAKSLTFALATATTDAERETFAYQYCPGGAIAKTTGERSITITVAKAGTLTIYPRSANGSATDRTMTVQQNGTNLLDAVTVADNDQVTIGEKNYFKAYAVEVAAGTVNILTNNGINFSAFKFVAKEGGEEGGEGGEGGESTSTDPVTLTFDAYADKTAEGAADDLTIESDGVTIFLDGGSKAKIAEKSLTFALATATTDAERETFKYQYCPGGDVTKTSGERSITITVAKAGTLTIYPRSANGTATNRTVTVEQNGTALLDAATVADNDQVTIGEKTYYKAYAVEVAAGTVNIKTAGGGINFSAFKFAPVNTTTAIEAVKTTVKADNVMYNLAGQKVAAGYKGIAIMNGKKVVIK